MKFTTLPVDLFPLLRPNITCFGVSYVKLLGVRKERKYMVSFIRRLGALFYDAISITVIIFFASFLPVLFVRDSIQPGSLAFQAFLVFVTMSYFVYCWRRGQTFGMKAWGVELQTVSGKPPTLGQLSLRFFVAIFSFATFGFGYFIAFISASGKTWHDQISGTYLVKKTTLSGPVIQANRKNQEGSRRN